MSKIDELASQLTNDPLIDELTDLLYEAAIRSSTVAQKYILVDQSGRLSCYPHKRSMLSGGSAECSVTDLIQPLTYIFPEQIRRPRRDVGGNRSASPEPLYDSELRPFSFMVGWGDGSA